MMDEFEITDGMDFDDWQNSWILLAESKGHQMKKLRGGRVDFFVTNPNGHNGPGCHVCGWTECMHCDWKGLQIPECPGTVT